MAKLLEDGVTLLIKKHTAQKLVIVGFKALVPGFVKKNMVIGGITYHPTFLYESFLNFVILVFLLVIRRFRVLKLVTP